VNWFSGVWSFATCLANESCLTVSNKHSIIISLKTITPNIVRP